MRTNSELNTKRLNIKNSLWNDIVDVAFLVKLISQEETVYNVKEFLQQQWMNLDKIVFFNILIKQLISNFPQGSIRIFHNFFGALFTKYYDTRIKDSTYVSIVIF